MIFPIKISTRFQDCHGLRNQETSYYKSHIVPSKMQTAIICPFDPFWSLIFGSAVPGFFRGFMISVVVVISQLLGVFFPAWLYSVVTSNAPPSRQWLSHGYSHGVSEVMGVAAKKMHFHMECAMKKHPAIGVPPILRTPHIIPMNFYTMNQPCWLPSTSPATCTDCAPKPNSRNNIRAQPEAKSEKCKTCWK